VAFKDIYYTIKPLIPRRFQVAARQMIVAGKRRSYTNVWPIDDEAKRPPAQWKGWPLNKEFALILTHDVDTEKGLDKCCELAQIEMDLGFRSSFNFVPERYKVPSSLRQFLEDNGFEVGVHGLLHDGKLYKNRKIFVERSVRINRYLKEWNSVGFRSPAMHRNLDWIGELDIVYDSSTFDTDPFEPQSEGVGTIFPFWVDCNSGEKGGYVELPYTLPQDFTLFVLMKEDGIDVWMNKLKWIYENSGMALLNTHPDYMSFNKNCNYEEYQHTLYVNFLMMLNEYYDDKFWNVLPRDIAYNFSLISGMSCL